MSHLDYFGLHEEPFRLTPDRDFFFPAESQTEIAEVIRFGVSQGEGFMIVTGEVGTGKTMLLRFLMEALGEECETALLLSPLLTPKQLLLAILCDIGLEEKANSRLSLDHLLRILNDHLYQLSRSGRRLLVIVDEAQNLPDESIEQLRLLSNFESDKQKLMQILLVGQPELRKKIGRPHLRQLLQRVSINETMQPLSRDETALYVHFRLKTAGCYHLRLNHGGRAFLWRYSKGVPRMINKLMARALLVAYARQSGLIDRDVLKEAAASFDSARRRLPSWAPGQAWLITAALAGIILALFITLSPQAVRSFFSDRETAQINVGAASSQQALSQRIDN